MFHSSSPVCLCKYFLQCCRQKYRVVNKRILHFQNVCRAQALSPLRLWRCSTVLSMQGFVLILYLILFFRTKQETGSQWTVRVCVLISPPRLRTLGSMLRLHTHHSVFAPRRTDTFPFFFVPFNTFNPLFSGFPHPHSSSLSLSPTPASSLNILI